MITMAWSIPERRRLKILAIVCDSVMEPLLFPGRRSSYHQTHLSVTGNCSKFRKPIDETLPIDNVVYLG
jgi:hypothetical protein